ncbi:MAG: ATP synthase F1 subunit delta [Deltaproteobacteria bacterium]|nr:ATP synthase F1 subunit delta [Deltaproteobacteria bacterium]
MIRARITKRYTRALFEIAGEAGKVDAVREELEAVESLLANSESVREGLTSPVVPREVKAEIVETIAGESGLDPLVANFLRVLLDARKLVLLPDVVASFREMADEASGRVRGVAASRMPLDRADLDALARALSSRIQKEVHLEARLDPSLGGGIVARVGNLVFDGSIRTQLQRMKETLSKG